MVEDTPTRYLIDELAATAGEALERAGVEVCDGRAGDRPDTRTVRWYTSLGLLDTPLREGRHAVYGARQLRQLLAVKHLQARGMRIAQIQDSLAGASDAELDSVISSAGDGRFWAATPRRGAHASNRTARSGRGLRRTWELELGQGLRLVGQGEAPRDPDAIVRAAAELITLTNDTSRRTP